MLSPRDAMADDEPEVPMSPSAGDPITPTTAATPVWQPEHRHTPLGDAEVDVWWIPPKTALGTTLIADPALAESERARARRYRFDRDRDDFLRGRLALRGILAGTIGCRPVDVRFCGGPGEKPTLPAVQRCCFSFSRSAGCGLCAVTRIGPVGIDIEAERPMNNLEDLARDVFTSEELDELWALPREEVLAAFFRGWTRKEAYLKAVGVGLAGDLKSFHVPLRTDDPLAIFDSSGRRAERWLLRGFTPTPGYHAALVIAAPAARVRFWQWR